VKGDRVEVLVDVGGGVEHFEIVATRAGRKVEVSTVRGTVEVTEVTRSGQAVRSGRFMVARVVAIVEYPAAGSEPADPAESRERRRSRAGAADDTAPRLL
jgi:hypothetical protein